MSFIGEIRLFAGSYAPAGWAICDGTLLTIEGFEQLYMLIGTTYGGDGEQTFAVPDLRSRVPVSLSNAVPLGSTGSGPIGLAGASVPLTYIIATQGSYPQE